MILPSSVTGLIASAAGASTSRVLRTLCSSWHRVIQSECASKPWGRRVAITFGLSSNARLSRNEYERHVCNILQFDAARNIWDEVSLMPEPRHGHAAVADEGVIYILGGCGWKEPSKDQAGTSEERSGRKPAGTSQQPRRKTAGKNEQ